MSRAMGRNREDIEIGCTELLSERRTVAWFITTVVALVFIVLYSHILFSSDMIWIFLGVLAMAIYFAISANCQQHSEEAEAEAHMVSDNEQNLEEPLPAPRTREQLPELMLRLALTDRDFDDLDYEDLRALDEDNTHDAPSSSETGNNGFMVQSHIQKQENGLACIICLERFIVGELIRSLPCLHQFHAYCVDQWLREQGTCPTCKYRVAPGTQVIVMILSENNMIDMHGALMYNDLPPNVPTMSKEDTNAIPVHGNRGQPHRLRFRVTIGFHSDQISFLKAIAIS